MRIAAGALGVVLAGAVLVVAFPSLCLRIGARLVALFPPGTPGHRVARCHGGGRGGTCVDAGLAAHAARPRVDLRSLAPAVAFVLGPDSWPSTSDCPSPRRC